jgi:hypothetical protein
MMDGASQRRPELLPEMPDKSLSIIAPHFPKFIHHLHKRCFVRSAQTKFVWQIFAQHLTALNPPQATPLQWQW